MKIKTVVIGVLLNLFAVAARADVLATGQLLTPLSPDSASNISIPVPPSFDRSKPLWAVYQLVAVSADSDPEGEVVIDSSFEGVPVPITDSIVIFNPRNLNIDSSAGTLGQQLEALVGQRSPEELTEIFGAELYEAYVALNNKKGAYLTGNVSRVYQHDSKTELVLLTNVERAKGIQPVMVNVVVGQGDIPAQYQKSSTASLAKDKLVMVIVAFLFGLFFWYVKRL